MVVLLAENDVGVRFTVWNLLMNDGFTILSAGDGIAALELSRNYQGTIDLLLSDMDIPLMRGLGVCQIIAAERPGIKVLIMSGGLQGREQAHMNGWPSLQKPFTATALRQSIKALLGPTPPLP